MEYSKKIELAHKIVRGTYHNFGTKEHFINTSSIYRFTNEDITSYYHHLENKEKVLTVIGSGNQIINGILAGTKKIDCFDISIFPEYYLYLNLAAIMALNKEEYLKYFLSNDREEVFSYELYEKISFYLKGEYKQFWDSLYNFNEDIDIYNSLLFRQDFYKMESIIEYNPYLQDKNYERIKNILKTSSINIKTMTLDILKMTFYEEYDLVNLSNILSYYFDKTKIKEYITYLKNNFNLTPNGEIINYFYNMSDETIEEFEKYLKNYGYIENIKTKKLVVYKNNNY